MAELAAANEEEAWSDEDWQAFPPLYTLQPHGGDARGAAERVDRFTVALVQGPEQLDRGRGDLRRFVNARHQPEARRKRRAGSREGGVQRGAAAKCWTMVLCSCSSSSRRTSRGSSTSARATGKLGGVFTLAELRDDGPLAAPTRGCGRRRWTRSRPRTGGPSSRARVGRGGREVFRRGFLLRLSAPSSATNQGVCRVAAMLRSKITSG